MRNKLIAGIAVIGLLAFSSPVMAGSTEMLGASSRGTAMGGAMVSIASGSEATYYNPASLALSPNTWSVEYSSISAEMMLNDENNMPGGTGVRFGFSRRFLRDRLGLGLLVGMSPSSAGLSLDFGSLGGGIPNWNYSMYKDDLPLLLNFGIGLRITDWLSVGISGGQCDSLISLGYFPVVVDPILEQLIGISTGAMPTNVENYNFSVGADPDSEMTYGFNVNFRTEYLSLGYLYKPEVWSRYKLRVELVGGGGSILPNSQYILMDMKIPGQVETTVYGGAGHIPIPWNDGSLTVAYAHEIQNWSGFYPSSVQYQWEANDTFTSEWFDYAEPRDPGLEDVEFDRYGLEYEGDATALTFGKLNSPRFYVRGGYYHWNSPQPEDVNQDWQVGMVDSDADIYSFGLGLSFARKEAQVEDPLSSPRVQVDFHFQQVTLEERDYTIQPDAWNDVPLDNYYVQTEGSLTHYGLQVTWWQ